MTNGRKDSEPDDLSDELDDVPVRPEDKDPPLQLVKEDVWEHPLVTEIICRIIGAPINEVSIKETEENRRSGSLPPPSNSEVGASLTVAEVTELCQLARKSLLRLPSLINLNANQLPLTVVGDIHGNLIHLRRIFYHGGWPSEHTYLFLGDYVDRGWQSIETICFLLSLQFRYPTRVYLLRGNHEDGNTTLTYGLYEELNEKYGEEAHGLWRKLMDVFMCLPVAARINQKIMCMHGGLSPFLKSMEDLETVSRPAMVPPYGILCDLVWADPGEKYPGWALSHRGMSFTFGPSIVDEFCKKYGVEMIIRAHQIVPDMYALGYRWFGSGRLVTIFSSCNYVNYHNNAAVVHVSKQMRLHFVSFRCRKFTKGQGKKAGDSLEEC